MIDFFGSKREKTETNVLLDIGTETVKALLFEKKGSKIKLLASALEYFDRYGIFDTRDLEKDILKKAIFRAIQKLNVQSNKSIILGLPADILKARIIYQNLKRSHPKEIINEKEEREIRQKVIEEAKKDICQIFSQQSGILPSDIQFINLKILETKIDGYKVPALHKYEGENLTFMILATFLPHHNLEEIKTILESMDLKVEKVIHEAEGLSKYFSEKTDGILVDIGGTITQIFLVRNGVLEKIDEFRMGGQIFSKAISEKLGLAETQARILKERYAKKELSKESSDRIKEILLFASQTWFENLKLKLREMTGGFSLPLNIILFGGGSQLPDVKDVLKIDDRDRVSFGGDLGIKILDNPQETPLLLMTYAKT